MKTYKFGLLPDDEQYLEVLAGRKGGILMFKLPHKVSKMVTDWGKTSLKDNEIYPRNGGGREKSPHITIRGGIIADDSYDVSPIFDNFPEVEAVLGDIGIFKMANRPYDVIKIAVNCHDLTVLNDKVADYVEVMDPEFKYTPHITVAYVEKGSASRHDGAKVFSGRPVTLDTVIFANKNKAGSSIFKLAKRNPEPPKEQLDYGNDMRKNSGIDFMMQDVEEFLLSSGRSIRDLSRAELAAVIRDIHNDQIVEEL
jgi:hypothetical protein